MENTNIEKSNKEPMTTKQKVIFGLKIAGNVVFYAIIILLFLFSIMNINAGGKGGMPNLFGRGYLSVKTNSMKLEGNHLPDYYGEYKIGQFESGDLVIVDMLNDKELQELKVGDVVTFKDENLKGFNTHRIVYIEKGASGEIISLYCQGDMKISAGLPVYDPADTDPNHMAEFNKMIGNGEINAFDSKNLTEIKAKVIGVNKGMGTVMQTIQDYWLWIFVLPVLALLLFEVFMVVKNFMDLKAEKQKLSMASDRDEMMAQVAAEKEKMRQELLAELKAQQNNQNADDNTSTPAENTEEENNNDNNEDNTESQE